MKDTDNRTIPETLPGDKRSARQRAYLLRCWYEEAAPGRSAAWHFSLEEVQQKRRIGFRSLEALLRFLEAELDKEAGTDAGQSGE